MKRVIFIILAIFIFLWAASWTLVSLLALVDPEEPDKDAFYFLAGSSIIGFVISWLLLNISRRK